MTKTQILFRGEKPVLKNTPVGSSLVKSGKKLSIAKVVGDFSLIPTKGLDLIGMIGNQQLEGISIPTCTKSAKKGWRLTAKW